MQSCLIIFVPKMAVHSQLVSKLGKHCLILTFSMSQVPNYRPWAVKWTFPLDLQQVVLYFNLVSTGHSSPDCEIPLLSCPITLHSLEWFYLFISSFSSSLDLKVQFLFETQCSIVYWNPWPWKEQTLKEQNIQVHKKFTHGKRKRNFRMFRLLFCVCICVCLFSCFSEIERLELGTKQQKRLDINDLFIMPYVCLLVYRPSQFVSICQDSPQTIIRFVDILFLFTKFLSTHITLYT